jgi:hypothetical protein
MGYAQVPMVIRPFRWLFSRTWDRVPCFGDVNHKTGGWRDRADEAICRLAELFPDSWYDQNDPC